MPFKGDDPAFWEARAEEARAIMQKMTDPQSRRLLTTIAESYEELAERTRSRLSALK